MSAHDPHEQQRATPQKETAALLWIIVGLLGVVACCVGIERMVMRY
jgi:hypothetical protein